jgi:hypothetical protein
MRRNFSGEPRQLGGGPGQAARARRKSVGSRNWTLGTITTLGEAAMTIARAHLIDPSVTRW